MNLRKSLSLLLAAAVLHGINAEESGFENLWDYTKFVETENDNFLKLSGRIHLDYYSFDGEEEEDDDFTWRRFRVGLTGKYRELHSKIEADLNFNESGSEVYNRLTDAYISWKPSHGDFAIKALKHSAGFTLDGKTSSNKLLTPQRNNLTNNLWFTAEYFTGLSIKGKMGENWSYNAGVFSSDPDDEIGVTQGSVFTLLTLNRKLSKGTLWDKGKLSVDYVYNDTHDEGGTRDFSDVISLSSNFEKSRLGLSTDFAAGRGDLGQSDVWGFVVMPYFKQSDMIHWVVRYTYMESEDANGLRLGRYESRVVSGRGDQYSELFGGVNLLFNDHKFKFQLGVQYADMQDAENDGGDYDGYGLTASFRAYW